MIIDQRDDFEVAPTSEDRRKAADYQVRGLYEESHDLLVKCWVGSFGLETHEKRNNGSCRCGLYIGHNQSRYVSIWNWMLYSRTKPTEYAYELPVDGALEYASLVLHMMRMDRVQALMHNKQSNFYQYDIGEGVTVHVVIDHWGNVHRVMLTEVTTEDI
jgi:hypothetical protein